MGRLRKINVSDDRSFEMQGESRAARFPCFRALLGVVGINFLLQSVLAKNTALSDYWFYIRYFKFETERRSKTFPFLYAGMNFLSAQTRPLYVPRFCNLALEEIMKVLAFAFN